MRYIPDHKYRLLMYNALYNRDYSDALNYADEYVGMMYYYKATPELIEKAEKEVKRIKEMVTAKDYKRIETMLYTFREQNYKNYKIDPTQQAER